MKNRLCCTIARLTLMRILEQKKASTGQQHGQQKDEQQNVLEPKAVRHLFW